MPGRRLALVALAALVWAERGTAAQPRDPAGRDEVEIEVEPVPAPATPGSDSPSAAAPGSAQAPAAGPTKDPKLARKWLAAAQQLMQRGSYFAARKRPEDARPQFENAVTAYQRAIEAGDDASVYLDLANAEDRLGKLADAVRHLRRVTAPGSGARGDAVRKASARLDELLARVGLVTLVVTPPGAAITLGGAELGTAPLAEPLVLMPGTYTLVFQAEGFQPREAEITVEPGSEAERAIALDPVPVIAEPVGPAAAAAPPPIDRPGPPSKLPLYAGAGATAVAALDAAVFGALALAQHATFTGATTSRLARDDARINGKRFALIADVSLATAVVAAGFTAYWYWRHARPQKSDDRSSRSINLRLNPRLNPTLSPRPETKLGVVPWVQSRSGGAALAGWF
jgi:hypothetical protein